MKSPGFKQKFLYWFDNKMSKGTVSMIKMLAISTMIFVFVISSAVCLLGLQEEGGFGESLWDSFASTLNAWVFYSDDGSIAYIAVMALAAVVGLFVTSVLIGIVSSGIEERLTSLRRGKSLVLEKDHIVILGFNDGIYKLLQEICIAADEKGRGVIVVGGEEDKDHMEEAIIENVEIPKNVKIICRNVDICNPASIKCCAVSDCKTVIINESDDQKSVKSVLAAASLLKKREAKDVRITTSVFDSRNSCSVETAGRGHADVLEIRDIISRLIAHTCSQAGISAIFSDLLDFNGDEFYIERFSELSGKTFEEAVMAFEKTLVLGIFDKNGCILNPDKNRILKDDDELLIIAAGRSSSRLLPIKPAADESVFAEDAGISGAHSEAILILGYNDSFETIIRELSAAPEEAAIVSAGAKREQSRPVLENYPNVSFCDADIKDKEQLENLARDTQHIIILSDWGKDAQEADGDTIILLLNLREIKLRLGLSFNITAEMRVNSNKSLVSFDNITDFIISSEVSSMVVAQAANEPRLTGVFQELLSNHGNELYLKKADIFIKLGVSLDTSDMKAAAMKKGCIFLGYKKCSSENPQVVFNPPAGEKTVFQQNDCFIVLSVW